MKIALVVGHRKSAQGAVGSEGISEYVFWDDLLHELITDGWLSNDNEVKIFYRRDRANGYGERMRDLHWRIDAWGADISVSFHFNAAGNKRVDGHEVLYCSKGGKKLAEIMDALFDQYLDNRCRGIKKRGRKDRGGGFLCRGRSACILIEPFFASHQHLYADGGEERENLMSAIADFINLVAP